MDEHAIRLRKAWNLESPPGSSAGRVDLPLSRLALTGPFRLIRSWTRTTGIDPGAGLLLSIERTPGLRAVQLDDRVLNLTLPRLMLQAGRASRSRLVLECDASELTEEERLDWGHIALIIAPSPADR